jgi:hypothetical protein
MVSAAIFFLVAVAHLLRAVLRVPIQIGDWQVPMAVSWVGFVAAGLLVAWALALGRR